MNVLVTGGAGYLGAVLVPHLLSKGYPVHVIDKFLYGNHLSLASWCYDGNLSVLNGDARDLSGEAAGAVRWADVIIPLAAIVGAPACGRDPADATSTNVDAVRFLLESKRPETFVVIPTTNSGYGAAGDGVCDEDSPMNPLSLYARTKIEAERMVLAADGCSLRLATVYGMSPRMRLDLLVNDFVLRAVRDGYLGLFEPGFRRSIVHVHDIARAFAFILDPAQRNQMTGRVFNVAADNVTKRELCEKVKSHVPGFTWSEMPGEDPDKRDYVVSSRRLLDLGFDFGHTIDDGIAELVRGLSILPKYQHGNV